MVPDPRRLLAGGDYRCWLCHRYPVPYIQDFPADLLRRCLHEIQFLVFFWIYISSCACWFRLRTYNVNVRQSCVLSPFRTHEARVVRRKKVNPHDQHANFCLDMLDAIAYVKENYPPGSVTTFDMFCEVLCHSRNIALGEADAIKHGDYDYTLIIPCNDGKDVKIHLGWWLTFDLHCFAILALLWYRATADCEVWSLNSVSHRKVSLGSDGLRL